MANTMKGCRFLLRLVPGCALLAAQEFRATLTGRVVDPAGAAVPSVAVQVKNVGANEVATAVTDQQGNYAVRSSPATGWCSTSARPPPCMSPSKSAR